jgi:vitellogenic carboxypeptidase-like protein
LKTKSYSGLIQVNQKYNSNLFYLFFEANDPKPDTKLILYLNGGPGYASTLDTFEQNGPYNYLPTNKFKLNPFSWNNDYHLLYIDSPVNKFFKKQFFHFSIFIKIFLS